jgi:hypothetical protein
VNDPKGDYKIGCVKNVHRKVIFTILQRIKMVPKIILFQYFRHIFIFMS